MHESKRDRYIRILSGLTDIGAEISGNAVKEILELIKERRGHWVNVRISVTGESDAECDQCGAIVHNNFSDVINYCPNCGARMDEGDNNAKTM